MHPSRLLLDVQAADGIYGIVINLKYMYILMTATVHRGRQSIVYHVALVDDDGALVRPQFADIAFYRVRLTP